MTKTIYVCDKCKKEVDWLYKVPWVRVDGLSVEVDPGCIELCRDCMVNLCRLIRIYHVIDVDSILD